MKFTLGKRTESPNSIQEQTFARWENASTQSGDVVDDTADEKLEPTVFHLSDEDRVIDRKDNPVLPFRASSLQNKQSKPNDQALEFSSIKTALGSGSVIEGKLTFDEPVRIDGTLNGEVTSTSILVVGEQGTINADLSVQGLIVLGQVNGQVKSEDFIDIREGGRLEAEITSRRIMMQAGAFFDGKCSMKRTSESA